MYAVKVLEARQELKKEKEEGEETLSLDAGLQKDFLLEVYTMTGLVHPNIVRLVGLTNPLFPQKNSSSQN